VTGYTMVIADSTGERRVDEVISFVAEDASGSFGVQARHRHLLTVLEYGMARYLAAGADWRWLAMPGAVLRFAGNQLTISTRRCIEGTDYRRLEQELHQALAQEEQALSHLRTGLHRLEDSLLQRLREQALP